MQFHDPILYIHITVGSHLAELDTCIDVLSAPCLSFNYCLHVEHISCLVYKPTQHSSSAVILGCTIVFANLFNTLFRRQSKNKREVDHFDRLVLKGVFVHVVNVNVNCKCWMYTSIKYAVFKGMTLTRSI